MKPLPRVHAACLCSALPLLLVLCVCTPRESRGDEVTELYRLLLEGDYADAAELADGLGNTPEVLLLRARLLRETGCGDEAFELLHDSRFYKNEWSEFVVRTGALREQCGDRAGAEYEYRRTLQIEPSHIEARARLGLLLIAAGEIQAGQAELQELVEWYDFMSITQAASLSAHDYVMLGRTCEGLGRIRDAFDVMYESALEVDKRCIEALLASGELLMAKHNYADARTTFSDVLAINPHSAEAQLGLAAVTLKNPERVRERSQTALAALETADAVWPDHPRALELRGDLAFWQGRWDEALMFYRRAAGQDPGDVRRQAAIAAALQWSGGQEAYDGMCDLFSSAPTGAMFFSRLAEIQLAQHHYTGAVYTAKRAIALDEAHSPAYATLGRSLMFCDRIEEARDSIERAWSADKFDIFVYNTKQLLDYMDANFVEMESAHFTFRLNREDRTFLLPYLYAILDETMQRLRAEYNVELPGPIGVEAFSSGQYFAMRSVGLPWSWYAGMCFGDYVTIKTPKAHPGNWGETAVHELAHVSSREASNGRIPRWFTEGISVMEEGRQMRRWRCLFDRGFLAAFQNDKLAPLAHLNDAFADEETELLSYGQAGNICEFIREVWGFEALLRMLSAFGEGLDTAQVVQTVFSLSLEDFDARFLSHTDELLRRRGLGPVQGRNNIAKLERDANQNPTDAERWIALGLAHYLAGSVLDAELAISKALAAGERNAPSGDLCALRGFVARANGGHSAAASHLRDALSKGTRYGYLTLVSLASILAEEGEAEEAITNFQEALALYPEGITAPFPKFDGRDPYRQLAALFESEGREAEAIATLEALIEVSRDDIKLRLQVARHHRDAGDWTRLVAALSDAPYIDPYDKEVHELLALGYLHTGSHQLALRELKILQAYDRAQFDQIYADMAWCHLQLGERAPATELARKSVELNAKNTRANEVLGELAK